MAKEINEDLIIAVIYAFFGVLAWFYNMPTSEENCNHTGAMRLEKDQRKGFISGENFIEEIDEEIEADEGGDEE